MVDDPFPSILKQLPIRTMFAAPLEAAIDAQTLACQKTAEFIEEVGFTTNGAIRMVRVEYDEPRIDENGNPVDGFNKRRLYMPFIGGIAPIPNFGIDKLIVDFDLEVSTSDQKSSKTEEEGKATGKVGWGVFSVSFSGSISHKSEQTRKTDTRAKYTVHLEASRQEPPEAFMRVIDYITNSVSKPIIIEGGAEPNEAIGEPKKQL